jgi:hypothetical protein
MQAQVERPTMARKTTEQPIRVELEVARLAKVVAAYEQCSVSELVGRLLKPELQRLHRVHAQRVNATPEPARPKPKR